MAMAPIRRTGAFAAEWLDKDTLIVITVGKNGRRFDFICKFFPDSITADLCKTDGAQLLLPEVEGKTPMTIWTPGVFKPEHVA